MNRKIGKYGAELVPEGARILTHCNAGAIATGGFGTALGVVRAAHAAGGVEMVYCDETRPLLDVYKRQSGGPAKASYELYLRGQKSLPLQGSH